VRGTRPLARGPLTPLGLDPGRDILDCLDAARRSSPASADAPRPRSDPRHRRPCRSRQAVPAAGRRRGSSSILDREISTVRATARSSTARELGRAFCVPAPLRRGADADGAPVRISLSRDDLLRPRRDACAWRSSTLEARCARRAPPAAGGRVTSSRLSSQPASRRRGHSRQPQYIGMWSQCTGMRAQCTGQRSRRTGHSSARKARITVPMRSKARFALAVVRKAAAVHWRGPWRAVAVHWKFTDRTGHSAVAKTSDDRSNVIEGLICTDHNAVVRPQGLCPMFQ
jgi:hypothetical protein